MKSVGPHPEHTSLEHDVHKNDHDHGRPVSWREINRVLFVAAAAGGHLLSSRRFESPHYCDRCCMHSAWRFPDLSRGIPKHQATAHADGMIDDHCHCRGFGDPRNLYCSHHHACCPRRGNSGGSNGRRGRQVIQRLIDLLPSSAAARRQGEKSPLAMRSLCVRAHVFQKIHGGCPQAPAVTPALARRQPV